jgi:hypothetical protein
MPCALCGDIIPTRVTRCPACGALVRHRDFRALGIAVFMLLGFNAFVALGSAISLSRLVRTLGAATTDSYDPETAGRAVSPSSDAFVTSVMMAALTALLFLPWLWMAYREASPRRYRRVWAVAGWICPVVNLWLPPRLVYDMWVNGGRHRTAERRAIATVVTAWWVSLLAAMWLAWAFPGGDAGTLPQARLAVRLGIAAMAAEALAAVLCMVIVFRINRLHSG